jgi:hypothetical protein
LSFAIRICFEFRISIFGFCLNITFRSGTKYTICQVRGLKSIVFLIVTTPVDRLQAEVGARGLGRGAMGFSPLSLQLGVRVSPFTFHLSPFTFYLLPFTFYLLPFTFYLLPFTFYLLPFTFYLLPLRLCRIKKFPHSAPYLIS